MTQALLFPMAIGVFLIVWSVPIGCFFYFAFCREPRQIEEQPQEPQNQELEEV